MEKLYVPREVVRKEEIQPEEGGKERRIIPVQASCDFSQIDFTEPEIRRRLVGAYRVLLKYRARRLSGQSHD